MKIIEWLKNLLLKRKEKYMLSEGNIVENTQSQKEGFIPKVEINHTEHIKSREDIIRSLKDDIIIEDLSEEYNYTKFSPENIRKNYDENSVLSDEDMTALSCLYGAIKEGNIWNSETEIVNDKLTCTNNKINEFLKQSPNNIVILINLMEKSAKNLYESLEDKKLTSTTVQDLIPGSYDDISQLIEEHIKENKIEER